MNVDADALSHIPMGDHNQHIDADSVHALISQAAQGTTLIGAYFCNMQVTQTLRYTEGPKSYVGRSLDCGPK